MSRFRNGSGTTEHRRSVFTAKRQKNLLVRVMSRFQKEAEQQSIGVLFSQQKAKEFVSACYGPLPKRKRKTTEHRRSVFAAKRQKNLLVRVMSRFRNGSGNLLVRVMDRFRNGSGT